MKLKNINTPATGQKTHHRIMELAGVFWHSQAW
jgi:hypothetical protein